MSRGKLCIENIGYILNATVKIKTERLSKNYCRYLAWMVEAERVKIEEILAVWHNRRRPRETWKCRRDSRMEELKHLQVYSSAYFLPPGTKEFELLGEGIPRSLKYYDSAEQVQKGVWFTGLGPVMQELGERGCENIWLLPVYENPLSDLLLGYLMILRYPVEE